MSKVRHDLWCIDSKVEENDNEEAYSCYLTCIYLTIYLKLIEIYLKLTAR